ncbi:hypothetical protein PSTG_08786 [Puccinia striiformis f. sp. tritici PST-78]|uniref:Uncharacterized protein n=1 Tax=Puccinia striiformis f. sp. tritici PST-78 TaxID=1165861 RepID=A0A0L0VF75_9BASI|nr:hypothetical protein PSTG_08786 [Puccinia striiformis f. sp. tritici PST-78]
MNTFLFLIPFIIQYFTTGMQPPRGELASLGQESAIDNRGGILDFSPPPRMVDLSPVDQVSIDMPPRKDVSAYDTMIGEHNSPYKIPTYPAGRDARDRPISSDLAITRTRDGLDCGTRGLIAATRVQDTKPQPPGVLVVACDPSLRRAE